MIRRAREADAEAWVRLAVSMGEYYPGLDPDQHARIVRKCARSGEALVAELDGAFAGGLLYSRKREELSFLMVAPWARRHSLARAMVKEMLGDFPGGSVIRVTTYRAGDPLGDAARPFYESLGFVPGAEIVSHDYPEQEFSLFLPLLTRRLALRPFRAGDFDAFYALLDLPELPGLSIQKLRAREFLDWYIDSARRMDLQNGVICLGAFDRLTGELYGFAGVGRHDDLGEPEVFYAFLPSARGKGYATEACRAVSEWALARFEIPHLIGTAGAENAASRRVLEKTGYEFIDVRTLDVHITGDRCDFAYYLRYRPEIAPLGGECRGIKIQDAIATDRVYEVATRETESGCAFSLVETALEVPRAFEYRAELLEDWLERPTLLGATLNGARAGYAEGFLESWNNRYRITNLFVEPAFRGRGAGRALLRAMIEAARGEGARAIALETQSFNFPAIALYRSCGFRFIGIDTTTYSNGDIEKGNVRIEMGMPL